MDAEVEELLATFLTIMDESGPLGPDTELRVLGAIRQAGVDVPFGRSTARPRWVLAVMMRTLDCWKGETIGASSQAQAAASQVPNHQRCDPRVRSEQ
jgi:hypothetical protein